MGEVGRAYEPVRMLASAAEPMHRSGEPSDPVLGLSRRVTEGCFKDGNETCWVGAAASVEAAGRNEDDPGVVLSGHCRGSHYPIEVPGVPGRDRAAFAYGDTEQLLIGKRYQDGVVGCSDHVVAGSVQPAHREAGVLRVEQLASPGQQILLAPPQGFGLLRDALVGCDLVIDLIGELGGVAGHGIDLRVREPEQLDRPPHPLGDRHVSADDAADDLPDVGAADAGHPATSSTVPEADERVPTRPQAFVDQLLGERGSRGGAHAGLGLEALGDAFVAKADRDGMRHDDIVVSLVIDQSGGRSGGRRSPRRPFGSLLRLLRLRRESRLASGRRVERPRTSRRAGSAAGTNLHLGRCRPDLPSN